MLPEYTHLAIVTRLSFLCINAFFLIVYTTPKTFGSNALPWVILQDSPAKMKEISLDCRWKYLADSKLTDKTEFRPEEFQSFAEAIKQIPPKQFLSKGGIFCLFQIQYEGRRAEKFLLRLARNLNQPEFDLLKVIIRDEPRYVSLFELNSSQLQLIARGGKQLNGDLATYAPDKSYLPFMMKPGERKTFLIKINDALPFRQPQVYLSTPKVERLESALTIRILLPVAQYYVIIIGLLFFMAFNGFARFFFFSDQSFLYYGLYVALNALYFLTILDSTPYSNGFIYDKFQAISRFTGAILILSYGFYIRFGILFLRLDQQQAKPFSLMYNFSLCLAVLVILTNLALNHLPTNLAVGDFALISMMIIGLICIVRVWKMQDVLARIIIIGTLFFYTGSIIGFLEVVHFINVKSSSLILQSPIFPTTIGCIGEAIIFFGGLGYRQKLLQDEKLTVETLLRQQMEQNMLIMAAAQAEKELIARNLHDEIGSTLSSISIISEAGLNKIEKNQLEERLKTINARSREMMENMSDLVWSINVGNSDLGTLMIRMREFAVEPLEAKNIDLHLECQESLLGLELHKESMHDFYLFFKEAINNAAKYSHATKIWVSITQKHNQFILQIKDNGLGFDPDQVKRGNGLKNMQERALRLNGKFNLKVKKNGGTTVTLTFPHNDPADQVFQVSSHHHGISRLGFLTEFCRGSEGI